MRAWRGTLLWLLPPHNASHPVYQSVPVPRYSCGCTLMLNDRPPEVHEGAVRSQLSQQ